MLGNEQVTIIGHIGQDASIKEHNGNRFISFTIAVDKGYKNANGDWVSVTNWWSVIIRNEKLMPYLTKGKYIMVQGDPKIKTFRNQEGVTLPALNLNADGVHFLKQKKDEGQQAAPRNNNSYSPPAPAAMDEEEDDLPF